MSALTESASEASAEPVADAPLAEWSVLCVDDEPNVVSALRRLFRGTGYRVLTATSGAEALEVFARDSVDLIISDMRMPGMDGAQLLEEVRARWPATTRMLLTGYADVQSSMAAINRGEVYRYLTKPWNDDEILTTVNAAFERQALEREKRRLEVLTRQQAAALRELNAGLEGKVAARTAELQQASDKLKRNYLNSIKAFSHLIELRGGHFVGHARRTAELARRTARAMGLPDAEQQEVFIAGLLHDIGQIGLPDAVLTRSVPRLSDEESALYRRHPAMGEQALLALDDMQPVATLIRAHHERHDGRGFPDGLVGHAIAEDELRLPANVVAERFVPHASVLPDASLVVTHAGHGTIMAAVTAGVPMLCTPMGRDQHAVAACVAQRRLGVVVPTTASTEELKAAIAAALADRTLHDRARAFAAALDLPDGLRRAIDVLERLASAA